MTLNGYAITLQHDNGKITLLINSSSEKNARQIACSSEGCPECAIIRVKENKNRPFRINP